MNQNGKPILREEQLFRKAWTGWIMLPGALIMTGVLVTSFYELNCAAQQGRPMPPWFIWLVLALLVVVNIGLYYLYGCGKLVTEIRVDGIAVRFFPLTRDRFFPWSEIVTVEARHYRPIFEYGGWGVRGLGKNKAWNVSGNEGLQLVFKDGRRFLIGSQMAAALEEAAHRAREESCL